MSKLSKKFRTTIEVDTSELENSRDRYTNAFLLSLGYSLDDPRTTSLISKIHDMYDSDINEAEAVNFITENKI